MPESATAGLHAHRARLHWVTAALVLTMIPIGVAMANADFGAWQDTLYHLHRSIGAVLLPLVLGRLIWRLTHPAPPLPADIPAIQQFAAHATHWALYALLIAQPIGWLDRDVGLSRADPVVLAVRTAADLARGQSLLRDDVHRAPGHRHRDCAPALRSHRRRALSPLHPQGRRPDAHGQRLSMAVPTASRAIGDLTFQEVGTALARKLDPVPADGIDGAARPASAAQHRYRAGRAFTGRIVERWGEAYDLWRLPPIAVGLSREHDWAAGTLSLSVGGHDGGAARSRPRDRARSAGAQSPDRQRSRRQPRHSGGARPRDCAATSASISARCISGALISPVHGCGGAGNPRRQGRNLGDAGAGARPGAPRAHRRTQSAAGRRRGARR